MAYKTIYPFTNETLKEYANHTDAELEQAIAAGHALYKKWRCENNLDERKAQLHKVADLLRRDVDKYAEVITKDMGKLIGEAKGEVLLCADIADYFAGHIGVRNIYIGEVFGDTSQRYARVEALRDDVPYGEFQFSPVNHGIE